MSELWERNERENEEQEVIETKVKMQKYDPMTGEPIIEETQNSGQGEQEDLGYYHFSKDEIPKEEYDASYNPYMNPNRALGRKKVELKPVHKKWASCVAMGLVFGLVAGGTMWGVNAVGNKITGGNDVSTKRIETTSTVGEGTPTGVSNVSSTGSYSVAEVAKNAMPSIVAITNKSVQEVQSWFGGQSQSYESESSGSGIIVGQNDEELLIATNNHVVSGATKLSVAFADNQVVEAQIKGTEPDKDLAVIAVKISDIKQETLDVIKVVKLAAPDGLEVGEQVVAIGNALGYGQSVTAGYVSALDRDVTIENVTNTLIQTDAAINPGNSGGALLNMKGELIGINAAKFASSEVEGMGYAIPVKTAKPILDELMNRKTRSKVDDKDASYVGISARTVSAETAQMYGMPQGVYVAEVTSGGPAEAAGVKKGDVITKIDGITVASYEDLINNLQYYAAGESVEVVVSRADAGEYKEATLEVKLGKKSEMPETTQQGSTTLPNQGQQGEQGQQKQIPDIFDMLP